MPPPPVPDPQHDQTSWMDLFLDLMDVMDTSDACPSHQSWADEVAEAKASPPQMMEDDLMDTWLEATKHTGTGRNVMLVLVVIKLIMVLLCKVTASLKDSHQAHQCIDKLEAKLAELTVDICIFPF
ncbi:hypothetical protein CROQUDRAFT_86612 [Cronartium quercuum f. sp. fusiforme G11]|uniref:Uncharacterized protein n=1 Tax=Cronartium quercuum f. sp. fusiforme G11 TaxID=708437 RepID=A0A9P6TI96_9BASI|nr:hypothetical protein CROQUDRAFT_86612 [Cronartium quercuum f. sp. fusiforme G11]